MKLIKEKSKIILITFGLLFLFIIPSSTNSQAVCGDLEFLKLTANGLQCTALPDRTSNTYVSQTLESIIHPAIPLPPLTIPTCEANQKYIYIDNSWGCRADTLDGIEFLGCPTGQFLNKITGGIGCSSVVAATFPAHEHQTYASLTHSHANTSPIDHTHAQYALKTHTHTYPTCTGAKVLQYDGTNLTCVGATISIPTCSDGQFLTANGRTFSCGSSATQQRSATYLFCQENDGLILIQGGVEFCRLVAARCPSPSVQHRNWSTTTVLSSGCTTGSHAWSSASTERCTWTRSGRCLSSTRKCTGKNNQNCASVCTSRTPATLTTVSANVIEIGCKLP